MRFASVTHQDRNLAVLIRGEEAVPLRGISELGAQTPSSLLATPPLDEAAAFPVAELSYRPVIPAPAKIICVGLNYKAHIEETGNKQFEYPAFFTKFQSSLIGPYDEIQRPRESQAVDFEGELTVVIGEHTRRVSREQALQKVAGYTVGNDTSMRDYQYKTSQYLAGKAWDASTPIGPWLVTADEVGDPQQLELRTTLNGQVVQEASTAQMIFDVATVVSTISGFTALNPGDVILTGTPQGVGYRREPPLLLGDGDVVSVEISGLGRTQNTVVDEPR